MTQPRIHESPAARAQRRQARESLSSLVVRQGYRCYWCDEKIARLHDLNRRGCKIIAIQRGLGRLVYRAFENGKTYHARVATVDPLGRGGGSKKTNLVAACYECNQTRDRLVRLGADGCKKDRDANFGELQAQESVA